MDQRPQRDRHEGHHRRRNRWLGRNVRFRRFSPGHRNPRPCGNRRRPGPSRQDLAQAASGRIPEPRFCKGCSKRNQRHRHCTARHRRQKHGQTGSRSDGRANPRLGPGLRHRPVLRRRLRLAAPVRRGHGLRRPGFLGHENEGRRVAPQRRRGADPSGA